MPPRFAYWTILAGGLPTSFRAADRDELMPTFRRLKDKHPDAEMKYFARGKLWESPEEARRARTAASAPGREQRDRNWRPGGDHRDPRQRFKDAKKARNQDQRQQRWEHKHRDDSAPRRAFRTAGSRRVGRQEEPPPRPRVPRPDREPPPGREPKPEPPPRPSEPRIKPPGPPERGRAPKPRRRTNRRRGE